jgi:hypothetical protein
MLSLASSPLEPASTIEISWAATAVRRPGGWAESAPGRAARRVLVIVPTSPHVPDIDAARLRDDVPGR